MTGRTVSHGGRSLRRFLAVLMAASLLVAACGGDDDGGGGGGEGEPEELQDVTFAISTCSAYSSAYFMADELGFWEDEGLNVEMQCVDGSTAAHQQLAAGNADISAGNAAAALPTFNEGVTLYPFFAYTRGAQADVMVPVDSDIQSIEDLKDKIIGVASLAGAETPITRGYLVNAGIDPDTEIQLVEVGADPAPVQLAFERGDIDAVAATQGDLGVLQTAGLEIRSVVADDLKEQLSTYPSGLIFANEDSKDDTEMLAGFARAAAKGYTVGFTNPDAAICILAEVIPEEFVDPDIGRAGFQAGAVDFALVPQDDDGNYVFNPEIADSSLLQAFVDFYASAGIVEESFDVNEVIIDVTEEANDWDQAEVVELAEGLDSDCEAVQ